MTLFVCFLIFLNLFRKVLFGKGKKIKIQILKEVEMAVKTEVQNEVEVSFLEIKAVEMSVGMYSLTTVK